MSLGRLGGLPAELRNRIYEYALFHEEGGGTISPAPTNPDGMSPARWTRTRTYEVDVYIRFGPRSRWQPGILIRGNFDKQDICSLHKAGISKEILYDFVAKHNGAWPEFGVHTWGEGTLFTLPTGLSCHFFIDGEEVAEDQRRPHVFEGHVCDLACLQQPALTKTNRQLRAETLSLFYSINTFNLNLFNYRPQRPVDVPAHPMFKNWRLPPIKVAAKNNALVDWWRSIGDTNLRSISRLGIVRGGEDSNKNDAFVILSPMNKALNVFIWTEWLVATLQGDTWKNTIPPEKRPKTPTRVPDSIKAQAARYHALANFVREGRLCALAIEVLLQEVFPGWKLDIKD